MKVLILTDDEALALSDFLECQSLDLGLCLVSDKLRAQPKTDHPYLVAEIQGSYGLATSKQEAHATVRRLGLSSNKCFVIHPVKLATELGVG